MIQTNNSEIWQSGRGYKPSLDSDSRCHPCRVTALGVIKGRYIIEVTNKSDEDREGVKALLESNKERRCENTCKDRKVC
jgi:hypothetical protein